MYLPACRKTQGRLALRILAFAVDVLPESIKKDYAEDLAEAWLRAPPPLGPGRSVKPCQAVAIVQVQGVDLSAKRNLFALLARVHPMKVI